MKLYETRVVTSLISECELLLDKELKSRSNEFHSVTLLKDIWLYYYQKLSQQQQSQISNQIKRCVRSKSFLL